LAPTQGVMSEAQRRAFGGDSIFVLSPPNGLATELRAESPSAPVACSPAAWRADKRTQSPARSPDRHAVGRTINELQGVFFAILHILIGFVKWIFCELKGTRILMNINHFL